MGPGPGYKVTLTAAGFADYAAEGIDLQVGQNVSLDVTLVVGATATKVDVTGAAELINDTKTDVSQVIGTQQIQELPINGRRVDNFVLLTPGVTNDGNFGLLTFRGVANGNSFLLDGNDSTEKFYMENNGGRAFSHKSPRIPCKSFKWFPRISQPSTAEPRVV